MDIKYLKPEYIGEEHQKMKVKITILEKFITQLTDKVQKQETEIESLKKILAESNCKNFTVIQDTQHSQNVKTPQNVQIPDDVGNVNPDGKPNSKNPQNLKITKNIENTKNVQNTKNLPVKKPRKTLRPYESQISSFNAQSVSNLPGDRKMTIQGPLEKSFAEAATSSPSLRPQTLLTTPYVSSIPAPTSSFPPKPSQPYPLPFPSPKPSPSSLGPSPAFTKPFPLHPGNMPSPLWHSQPSLLSFPPPPIPASSPQRSFPPHQRPSPSNVRAAPGAEPKKQKVRYYGDSNSKGRFSGSGIKDTILPELQKLGSTRYIPQAEYDIECHDTFRLRATYEDMQKRNHEGEIVVINIGINDVRFGKDIGWTHYGIQGHRGKYFGYMQKIIDYLKTQTQPQNIIIVESAPSTKYSMHAFNKASYELCKKEKVRFAPTLISEAHLWTDGYHISDNHRYLLTRTTAAAIKKVDPYQIYCM